MPIVIKSITKNYKRGRKKAEVLRGVSLSVADGAFACIVGPSGSGKSTLLRIMGGLMKPTSGTVTVNDEDLYKKSDRKLSKYRNQTIGFVFQDYRLIPHYSVIENVKVPLKIAGISGREQTKRAKSILRSVGLADYEKARVDELSGGQQQRVGIARAMVNKPKILIADEPTGNLDTKTGIEIMRILRAIQQSTGMTIIMVTHNPELAKTADQTIQLQDGVISRSDK